MGRGVAKAQDQDQDRYKLIVLITFQNNLVIKL